jgi:predicted CXXCH cytochrome family protein
MMLVLLFLYLFAGSKAPAVPVDELHLITTNEACMECHAPAQKAPLKKKHPGKPLCFDCHKVKKIKSPTPADHV